MPEKKLSVLFLALDAFGHINACTGLAQGLISRGHKIYFAIPKAFEGKLSKFGIEEVYYEKLVHSEEKDAQKLQMQWIDGMAENMKLKDVIEQMRRGKHSKNLDKIIDEMIHSNGDYKKIIAKIKPDVIIADTVFVCPAVEKSGIPWLLLFSPNPLMAIDRDDLPPGFSGLSIYEKDKFAEFRAQVYEIQNGMYDRWNQFLASEGSESRMEPGKMCQPSPYANFYMFPEELDYFDEKVPRPKKWFRFDSFTRHSEDSFEIPEKLKDLPGKLIYFSLGSIGVLLTEFMQRLIDILAKAPYRFIVSAGKIIKIKFLQ